MGFFIKRSKICHLGEWSHCFWLKLYPDEQNKDFKELLKLPKGQKRAPQSHYAYNLDPWFSQLLNKSPYSSSEPCMDFVCFLNVKPKEKRILFSTHSLRVW